MAHIALRISQLPDILQKSFCTPDGAMDPNLQVKNSPACLQPEKLGKNWGAFFWTLCDDDDENDDHNYESKVIAKTFNISELKVDFPFLYIGIGGVPR